jgi:hypothetical protein
VIGRLRCRLGQLRRYPRELYRDMTELREAITTQNRFWQQGSVLHEAQTLNQQLPEIADVLLQLLTQIQAVEKESKAGRNATAAILGHLDAWKTDRAGLLEALETVNSQIKEVARAQRELRWLLPSHVWAPEVAERVRQTLSALHPFRPASATKIRLGRPHDGGYVLIDDFAAGSDVVISLGIGDDVSWDLAMAERGLRVVMCDPTIDRPPVSHPRFEFRRVRIGSADGPDATSLETLLREQHGKGAGRIILKIDIEGAEWDALATKSVAALAYCSQIICEFHGLHRLADPGFAAVADQCFRALAQHFFVCHVHGNNSADIYNVGNVPIPDVLEVTFASRSIYQPLDKIELFPTALDQPNQPGRADIFLGPFRFT